MTDSAAEARLREAAARVQGHRAAGDKAAEAEARAEKAYLHASAGDFAAAAEELKEARRLHLERNDPRAQAKVAYGCGLVLERVPDRQDEALRAFRDAAALARLAADPAQEMQALHRVVRFHERRGDLAEAQANLTVMIERLEGWKNDAGLFDTYRHRAALEQARAAPDRALADLERALAAAGRLGDRAREVHARLERRALHPATSAPAASWESWEALAHDASGVAAPGLVASVEVQRAAAHGQRGEWAEAAVAAEAAREAALREDAVLSYLLACLLIAEAKNGLGDRVGTLAMLLTCKATLEKRLGPEAGEPLKLVLDALEGRWGKAGLERALAEYRERAKAGPIG